MPKPDEPTPRKRKQKARKPPGPTPAANPVKTHKQRFDQLLDDVVLGVPPKR